MALYHKWDVKNDFAYVLQFFALISESLGDVFNDTQRAFQHREELLIQRTVLERSNIFLLKNV